jgi:hypothetical protein
MAPAPSVNALAFSVFRQVLMVSVMRKIQQEKLTSILKITSPSLAMAYPGEHH